jgi:hypothetical protein
MNTELHLNSLTDQVASLLGGERPELLEAVSTAQQQWRGLHDRLIAIIAACVDEAVENGQELEPYLAAIHQRTSIGVENLVSSTPNPTAIAALLRAHNSTGDVTIKEDKVVFDHQCGSGLVHWRSNPNVSKVLPGEVDGVPAGVPRYCARCMFTIASVGQGAWRVSPPSTPDGRCRWEIDC